MHHPLLARLPATWRDFAAYLRAPVLLSPVGLRSRASWPVWGALLALNLTGLALLVPLVAGWQALTGLKGPDAFDQFPQQWLVPVVVLAAPVLEELLFRGWLSGRPRGLWLLVCALGGAVAMVLLGDHPTSLGEALLALLALGLVGWLLLRRWPVPHIFARRFSVIFYLAALVFGGIHLLNYANPGPLSLPLVLPQLWAGLVLGYARLRLGLPASMTIHALSNGAILALAALGG